MILITINYSWSLQINIIIKDQKTLSLVISLFLFLPLTTNYKLFLSANIVQYTKTSDMPTNQTNFPQHAIGTNQHI